MITEVAMYIMTHFLKNVLTFLFQYDIYISFCSKFVLGQKLPFALSELLSGRRETCTIWTLSTPSLLMGAPRALAGWSSLRATGTTSDFSSGPCSTGVTPPPNGSLSPERRMVCPERADAHRKSLAELAQPG